MVRPPEQTRPIVESESALTWRRRVRRRERGSVLTVQESGRAVRVRRLRRQRVRRQRAARVLPAVARALLVVAAHWHIRPVSTRLAARGSRVPPTPTYLRAGDAALLSTRPRFSDSNRAVNMRSVRIRLRFHEFELPGDVWMFTETNTLESNFKTLNLCKIRYIHNYVRKYWYFAYVSLITSAVIRNRNRTFPFAPNRSREAGERDGATVIDSQRNRTAWLVDYAACSRVVLLGHASRVYEL